MNILMNALLNLLSQPKWESSSVAFAALCIAMVGAVITTARPARS
ncbi:MAG: hypothetical protein JWN14_4190, partial [Chthonomonadales bacterium]|nr:hypothetical protein [Chthonomonadales bacterium]